MTTIFLDRHLAVSVDPQLPSSLISREHLRSLHSLARNFPSGITEFFGFESRLGDARAEVDFLLCAKAAEGGRDILAQQLSLEFLEHPVWQQIRGFSNLWAQPDTLIHDNVHNVWLEFDMPSSLTATVPDDAPQTNVPVPSLFIGTNALFRHNGSVAPYWLVEQALPLCRGRKVGSELGTALNSAIGALPDHANIFQIGMMLGRKSAAEMLRLCIRGLTQEQAQTYLQAIQWPGEIDEIKELMSFAYGTCDNVDIDIDLIPKIARKIGLECSFNADRTTSARLSAFLDRLVEQGLCLEAKRDGLLAWSKGFHERTDPPNWPADLRMRSASSHTAMASMFMRWVYHVKLVYVPGQPLEAKAYLAVRQAWMTPALMHQIKQLNHSATA